MKVHFKFKTPCTILTDVLKIYAMTRPFKPRPDNSVKDNSADLKFRQCSHKYADNSARDDSSNDSDRRGRANVLRVCQKGKRNLHEV